MIKVMQGDIWFLLQGVEVGVIGDMRQAQYPYLQGGRQVSRTAPQLLIQSHTVFLGEIEIWDKRHHAKNRPLGSNLDDSDSLGKQGHVAPQLVDYKSCEQAALAGRQQVESADSGGKHPAPIDIGYQQHCGPGPPGHTEINQITFL